MMADQPQVEGRLSCLWTDNDIYDGWQTECGKAFILNTGTPYENDMIFCCYCGGILREKAHERSQE